jgi:hypothetical protein
VDIDAVVSARLGPTRIQGNAQPACFNRQVAMYLAKHVAGWSTALIGRFYNGRDHSTVIHGIKRIEALRESDPEVDALLSGLKAQLEHAKDGLLEKGNSNEPASAGNRCYLTIDELADSIAERIWARFRQHLAEDGSGKE